MFFKDLKIILASGSPRRRHLLKEMHVKFDVMAAGIEELHPEGLPIALIPEYLAKEKAKAVKEKIAGKHTIIGADTVVLLNGEIIEKAAGKKEAKQMLRRLSGQVHTVISGVCILHNDLEISFSETTDVYFKTLTDEMIDYYVKHFEPFDKAGSYAIQEWIGLVGISKIEGSYFNVMGLPADRLYDELVKL